MNRVLSQQLGGLKEDLEKKWGKTLATLEEKVVALEG